MKKQVYIIYYNDQDGTSSCNELLGTAELKLAIKYIKESGGGVEEVYKRGKNFEEDHDDIIDVTPRYK